MVLISGFTHWYDIAKCDVGRWSLVKLGRGLGAWPRGFISFPGFSLHPLLPVHHAVSNSRPLCYSNLLPLACCPVLEPTDVHRDMRQNKPFPLYVIGITYWVSVVKKVTKQRIHFSIQMFNLFVPFKLKWMFYIQQVCRSCFLLFIVSICVFSKDDTRVLTIIELYPRLLKIFYFKTGFH